MTSIVLKLPYPPSVNRYWRNVMGKTLISERGRQYRNAVCGYVLAQKVPTGALQGKLVVEMLANPPDRRRRDLDNVLKASLDAIEYAGVIADDGDIDHITVRRGEVMPNGNLVVAITRK